VENSQQKLAPWICYLFGTAPKTNTGISYRPLEGNVPNRFIRWMMKVCLACTWVKDNGETGDSSVSTKGI